VRRVDAARRPWADDPRATFLASAGELRGTFVAAGLEPIVWNEQEAALQEIARQHFAPTVDPAQVGLDLLMPDFDVRMANVGRSIGEGRLRLLQAVMRAV
jgi:hypothetical protein